MLILGLILNALGIGLFCWLIFILAVHALPFFVALAVGLAAAHSGAGIPGAVLIAILAGALTLVVGQTAFALARSAILRAIIAAAFAIPAFVAGYHVVHDLSQIAVPSLLWREIFPWVGAIAFGATAWTRMTMIVEPLRPVEALSQEPQPALATTARQG